MFSHSEKVKDFARRFPLGHWSSLGPEEKKQMVWNAHYKPERQWNKIADVMAENLKEKWTSDIPRYHCAKSRNPEKERWKMYDSLHCGIFAYRALISHDSLSKSAQYLRSSGELVWRFGSSVSWSDTHDPGKSVAMENHQLSQKLEPQEVDSLEQTPRRNDVAAGHRLRIYLRKFAEMEKEV